jgi:hypothetical protein
VLTAADVRDLANGASKGALSPQDRARLKDLYEAVSMGKVVASPEALGLLQSTLNGLK